jgi:glycosyltransferase involved in cell wall biosynthesis
LKTRILYVETGRPSKNGAYGGSVNSIIQLIEKIDKSKFEIYFYLEYAIPNLIKYFNENNVVVFSSQKLDYSNDINYKLKTNLPSFLKQNFIYSYVSYLKKKRKIDILLEIIKNNKINIVHGNDRFTANINAIIASIKLNIPFIQHQRKFEKKIPFYLNKYINYPITYIAISNAINDDLKSKLNVKSQKIKTIHNWINFSNNVKFKVEKTNLDAFKFLWVGRIIPWKGIDILVKLAVILKQKKIKSFKFEVFGDFDDNSYKQDILNLIQNNNLQSFFVFHGYQSHANIFNNHYDLFIHTSKKPEPFGRTIIENMYQGIPVLATEMGGVTDIVKNNFNGFTYDFNDLENLSNIILKLIYNNDLKQKIISNAESTVENHFSGAIQINQINSIYDKL